MTGPLAEVSFEPAHRLDRGAHAVRGLQETVALIREENELEGKTLEELQLPTETGMWVIAIRRDVDWIFAPSGDEVASLGSQ